MMDVVRVSVLAMCRKWRFGNKLFLCATVSRRVVGGDFNYIKNLSLAVSLGGILRGVRRSGSDHRPLHSACRLPLGCVNLACGTDDTEWENKKANKQFDENKLNHIPLRLYSSNLDRWLVVFPFLLLDWLEQQASRRELPVFSIGTYWRQRWVVVAATTATWPRESQTSVGVGWSRARAWSCQQNSHTCCF